MIDEQDIIKKDELHYKSKRRKVYNLNEYSLHIPFEEIYMKDICNQRVLMMSKVDAKDDFAAKLKNLDKSKETIEKRF